MKTKLFIATAILGAVLGAQTTAVPKLYGWIVDGSGKWLTLGPTLKISSTGQLDAVIPASTAKIRTYNAVLTYDAVNRNWPLPTTASSIVITVNGVRYVPGVDYNVAASKLTALKDNLLPGDLVVADYDQ